MRYRIRSRDTGEDLVLARVLSDLMGRAGLEPAPRGPKVRLNNEPAEAFAPGPSSSRRNSRAPRRHQMPVSGAALLPSCNPYQASQENNTHTSLGARSSTLSFPRM